MPFYDYDCADCGNFSAWRSLADRDVPVQCPNCQADAVRLISAPHLSLMPASLRQAFAKNEKSRHEPGILTRHHCGSGCGCNSPRPKASRYTRSVDLGKEGKFLSRVKKKRPWMLGH